MDSIKPCAAVCNVMILCAARMQEDEMKKVMEERRREKEEEKRARLLLVNCKNSQFFLHNLHIFIFQFQFLS